MSKINYETNKAENGDEYDQKENRTHIDNIEKSRNT